MLIENENVDNDNDFLFGSPRLKLLSRQEDGLMINSQNSEKRLIFMALTQKEGVNLNKKIYWIS